jgi:hypothetical protein
MYAYYVYLLIVCVKESWLSWQLSPASKGSVSSR